MIKKEIPPLARWNFLVYDTTKVNKVNTFLSKIIFFFYESPGLIGWLFGEVGAVPKDGRAGFVNLIFGAAGIGAILEGETIAERQFERLTNKAVNLNILK